MQYNSFGLCLSCGAPFLPSIEAFIEFEHNESTIRLLRLENMVRRDEVMQGRLESKDKLHFITDKQRAHIMHASHHAPAIRFCVEHANDNKNFEYEFHVSPTSTNNRKAMKATWDIGDLKKRHVLKNLYKYLQEVKSDATVETLGMEYEITCDLCRDCNTVTTMQFWYRELLYGDNADRMIDKEVIAIKPANSNAPPGRFPKEKYDNKENYLSAYIAYFLTTCLPHGRLKTDENLARRVYLKCCWLTLQICCLVSEYKQGVRKTNKWPCNPKSLLGTIELYMSYFSWTISCYQFIDLPKKIEFAQWHQMYVCDLPNSALFRDNKNSLISHNLLTEVNEQNPLQLLQTISKNMMDLHKDYMFFIAQMLDSNFVTINPKIKGHFVHMSQWKTITDKAMLSAPYNFDELVSRVGIRVLWHQVKRLSKDCSPAIKQALLEFLDHHEQREIKTIEDQSDARNTYLRVLINPALLTRRMDIDKIIQEKKMKYFRGHWACVVPLYESGALPVVEDE